MDFDDRLRGDALDRRTDGAGPLARDFDLLGIARPKRETENQGTNDDLPAHGRRL